MPENVPKYLQYKSENYLNTYCKKKMDGNLIADDLRIETTSHVKYDSNALDAVKEVFFGKNSSMSDNVLEYLQYKSKSY